MNAPLCWPRWATPMREHDDQAALETALNWLGLGMMGLLLVLVPVIVLVPAMRGQPSCAWRPRRSTTPRIVPSSIGTT